MTPLPEATGFGTSVTADVMADFELRGSMKLLRLEFCEAMVRAPDDDEEYKARTAISALAGLAAPGDMCVEVFVEAKVNKWGSCAVELEQTTSYAGG